MVQLKKAVLRSELREPVADSYSRMSDKETTSFVQCYNFGCQQTFDPKNNPPDACTFHAAEPYFHDGYKIWKCCDRKFRDFTTFLDCKGCKKGPHNPIKPLAPEKPKDIDKSEFTYNAPKPPTAAPREEDPRMRKLPITVSSSLQQVLDRLSLQELETACQEGGDGRSDNGKECDKSDADSTNTDSVRIGELCKRSACGAAYTGPESLLEACMHHPGTAIFHEGMKFWSCCQRKTSDFTSFLEQAGCTRGKHAWSNKEAGIIPTPCRYDWHQTGSLVVLTLYAKCAQPTSCDIQANKTKLNVHLVFGEKSESLFDLNVDLWGAVDPSSSGVLMSGTKVEVKLKKADPVKWVSLYFTPSNAS